MIPASLYTCRAQLLFFSSHNILDDNGMIFYTRIKKDVQNLVIKSLYQGMNIKLTLCVCRYHSKPDTFTIQDCLNEKCIIVI